MRKKEINYRPLNVANLKIHPKVQREFRPKHARRIAEGWDIIAVNALTVVEMTSGDRGYYVIDGQHTLAAARMVGMVMLDCKVIKAKSHSEMEEIFQIINKDKLRLSPLDKFLGEARNQPGSQADIITRLLGKHGLTVGKGEDIHSIQSAPALRDAYKQLGRRSFVKAAELWEVIADNGHKVDIATVRAVAKVVADFEHDDLLMEEISYIIEAQFPNLHARATNRCVGSHLAHLWGNLYDTITEQIDDGGDRLGLVAA